MPLKFLILHFLIFLSSYLYAQTPSELANVNIDLTYTTHAINGTDFPTAIASHKGNIYYAYLDATLYGCIAKKDKNGIITTQIIIPNVADNAYHTMVGLAIDAEGYIHYIGNMHQTPMVYYRSVRAEDISAFTALHGDVANGGIFGPVGVTYGRFVQSRKGTLFFLSRQRLNTVSEGWVPGIMGGNIQVYNTDTKRWSQLGSLDYTFTGDRGQTITGGMDANHQVKAVFWDLSGAGAPPNNAYQGYKIRIVFDNNNRMHMVWNVAKNPVRTTVSDTHTHLMYAYSDDEGITWKRSNGTTLSLPIATANGEVVYMEDPNVNAQRMYNFCNIMFGNDNQPTILQQSYTQNKMLAFRLTGGNWVDVSSTINSAWPGEGYNDGNGWITFPAGSSTFRRTNDNGSTWLSYSSLPSNTGTHSIDYQYLYETGKVRHQRVSGTTSTVQTITFSGSTGGQVAQPEISVVSGSHYVGHTDVEITCPTSNTTIRYTTDGSLPTATNGTVYTGPITINNSVTLKARAFHNTKTESRLAASEIVIEAVLPVSIINFKGSLNKQGILLEWNTSAELNTKYFEILESTNGENFKIKATQKAFGKPSTYAFLDKNVSFGETYYYKLKAVDMNASSTMSQYVVVDYHENTYGMMIHTDMQTKSITLTSNHEDVIDMELYNLSGQRLQKNSFYKKYHIDTALLQPGIYIIKCSASKVGITKMYKVAL
ncbi:BNR-4 repeat-containing protein [Pedobacter glucosidilyticus]|uniref:BNR-4 repeat-containing protein n=1 Tax=Pedobacter glucosidilyticus TaxID=1122941 RepID=UPI0003FD57B4|nr:BNR-4 repeat-containing protein [Pedobacter glucosidilyticus]